jgi:hypothetical protein
MKKKKKPSDYSIKILKLNYGETLISYVKHDANELILLDPMVMVYIPMFDKNGNITNTEVAFRDWIEGSLKKEYRISKSIVLVETDCESVILNTYNKILMEDDKFFSDDHLKNTLDLFDTPDKGKLGPKLENFEDGEDEDDLDADGWDDVPPRFKP